MFLRNSLVAALSVALIASGAAAEKKDKKDQAPQVKAGRTPMTLSPEDQAALDAANKAAAEAQAIANAPKVGGVAMLPTRTIAENAALAPNLTTLVSAVKAAGLDSTLAAQGPYTVFAPTNEAFGRLAPGTVDTLLKPENKPTLTKVLTYHTIAGSLSGAELGEKVKAAGGTLQLTTVEGEPITLAIVNGAMTLTDVNGNKSYIEQYDVKQANGVVHVVNGVLIPKLG